MTLRLYNTLTRKKEDFVPIKAGEAGLYSCGPTVYNFAHIGNMRAYVFADVLRRTLKYAGYDVHHVMNITDVGHLVSDADEGEDKMEVGKKREGLDAWAIAAKYTDAFFEHAEKLHIERPETVCKATDHIAEQIGLIEKLEQNGLCYTTDDGVYFDTAKFEGYGRMAKLDIEGLEAGKRIAAGAKKNKTDFALWKFSPRDAQRDMEWDSPWGKGFPGWHIECSAMSMKFLGDQFDIHTGGIDHIQIHHTNEIAQSEGATGKSPFVRYWMHCEFLQLDQSIKMSKSKGNILTVDTLEEKGFDPLAFRYLCLTAHYRSALKFSWDSLASNATAYERICAHLLEGRDAAQGDDAPLSDAANAYKEKFDAALFDDLNTPEALAVIHTMIRDDAVTPAERYRLALGFDAVLGFGFAEMELKSADVPTEVLDLAHAREAARQNKQWDEADRLRDEIAAKGYDVKDTPQGPEVTARRAWQS